MSTRFLYTWIWRGVGAEARCKELNKLDKDSATSAPATGEKRGAKSTGTVL